MHIPNKSSIFVIEKITKCNINMTMNNEKLNSLLAQICEAKGELKEEILSIVGSYTENQLQDLIDIQGIGVNGERIIRISNDYVHGIVFYSEYHEYYFDDMSFEDLYYIYNGLR